MKFEISVNGEWIEVSENIFRSYTGLRKLDDTPYTGPRYVLGTDELISKEQKTMEWVL